MKIPLTKPFIGIEEEQAAANVLRSGWLTSGLRVEEFEGVVAEYTGAKYAVATGNCTQALHLALLACGIGSNTDILEDVERRYVGRDKVIVPSFTFPATANAVMHSGAELVFMDVNRETYNMDHLTGAGYDYDCILSVDLFGLPCRIRDVVQDAACGLGSVKHSNRSKATCYSFHPRKIITTGEGGMLVTNDDDVQLKARALRDHGQSKDGWSAGGYNYRMTDIQAAIGIEQMKKIDYIIDERRLIALSYNEALRSTGLGLPVLEGSNCQSYVVTYEGDRDAVLRRLKGKGVEATIGTYAVHRHHGLPDEQFPNASWLCDHTLSLPLYAGMTAQERCYVDECVKEAIDA